MRSLVACLALFVATVAQARVDIQHWTTPSGARVYFVESRALPIIDVQLDFAAGSAYDPPGKSGLAGMVAAQLDTGAGDLDEEQIAGRWVDLGARYSAGADADRASLSLRTLATPAERDGSLALLHTLLAAPKFPAAALDRERARAIAQLEDAETKPDTVAARRFTAAIYPDHPYGIVTSVASLRAIGRDDLVAFHKTYFGAKNAAISIIGDISRTEAEGIAQRLSDGLPAADPPAALPSVTLPASNTFRVAHPATQAHIEIGMPGYARGDPDSFPLLVGNYVLGGGGFVSRLMQEVREKRGLVYDVHSYFAPQKLAGPFQIGLQTRREQSVEAVKLVDATLAAFLRDGPTAAEINAAKQFLADGFALRLDSNAKLLGFVAMVGFYGLPLSWIDDYPKNVAAVSAAQVKAAFARHVQPEHLVTVIVAGD